MRSHTLPTCAGGPNSEVVLHHLLRSHRLRWAAVVRMSTNDDRWAAWLDKQRVDMVQRAYEATRKRLMLVRYAYFAIGFAVGAFAVYLSTHA